MAQNIVFIGMPSAGKSVLGKALQQHLPYMNFIDTDNLIENQTHQTLQHIINVHGYKYFRCIENDIIQKLVVQNAIISTGGSTVYSAPAMKNLQKNSHIIYLKAEEKDLKQRLASSSNRGIAKPSGQSWSELLIERQALYNHYAQTTINTSKNSVQACCQEILSTVLAQ